MIDLDAWIEGLLLRLDKTFGARVCFVGLQGSYRRGEADEDSDIDPVVILDRLSLLDLEAYRAMLDTLPHRELVCGFFSGKAELLAWEPSDLFQFYYDTKPLRGSLDFLLDRIDTIAVRRAVKIGACNIYHAAVHNVLHERSDEVIRALYKSAVFVVQAALFLQGGAFVSRHSDLVSAAKGRDRRIVETHLRLRCGEQTDFESASCELREWAQAHITGVCDLNLYQGE